MNSQSTLNIFYRSERNPSMNIHLLPDESSKYVDSDKDTKWYPEYQWLDLDDQEDSGNSGKAKCSLNSKSLNSALKKDVSFKEKPKKKVKFKKLTNQIEEKDNSGQYLSEVVGTIIILLKQDVALRQEDGCLLFPDQFFKLKYKEGFDTFINSIEYQMQNQILQCIRDQTIQLILNGRILLLSYANKK